MNIAANANVPVTFAPYPLDIDRGRRHFILPEGATLTEIMAEVLPEQPAEVLARARVTIVGVGSSAIVRRELWHVVRPKAHTNVVITIAPGVGAVSLLVQLAATALSSFGGTALAGTFGLSAATWGSIIGFGVTALGGLLVNALFQPKKPKKERETYIIDGWQNPARLDEQLPDLFGEVRHAPPIAASTYVEVVGDVLYNRAIFVHGLGQIELWNKKLGDTLHTKYDEFQFEHRNIIEKVDGGADIVHPDHTVPLTIYHQQVYEDSIGVEMVRELKRNDAGKATGGLNDPKPIRRSTGQNASHAIVLLSFPAGLIFIETDSGDERSLSVTLERRMRKAGTSDWVALPDITITNKKKTGFFRAVRFDFPSRGAWEIELTRITGSESSSKNTRIYNCTWALLQTFRPEYPINTDIPLALTAIRVKATAQMNGKIETFNAMGRRITSGFGQSWPTNRPRNPATSALWALLGPGTVKMQSAAKIDWQKFAEWFDYCNLKGLEFDYQLSGNYSLEDVLKMIGAAGRAAVYFDGSRWTVIVDKPRAAPIDVITPRNAENITFETFFPDIPDALRIKFQDRTNEYETAEMIVLRPGFVGEPKVTEALEMPGVTNHVQVFRAGTRRLYELQYRNVMYRATQDGLRRSATRGDLVVASHDIVRRAMSSARVKSVTGRLIEVDEMWEFKAGINYAISFRTVGNDSDDLLGQHVVRRITAIPGERWTFLADGAGTMPDAGAIIMVGEYGSESIPLIITGIQSRDDGRSDLLMLPSAEIIDQLTDARAVPAWDGKVGNVADLSAIIPEPPRIVSFDHDAATDITTVRIAPNILTIVEIASYALRHRKAGNTTWITRLSSSDDASVALSEYAVGDEVDMQVSSTSVYGATSNWSATVTATVSEAAPAMLKSVNAADEMHLGNIKFSISTSDDPLLHHVAVYLVPAGDVLDTSVHQRFVIPSPRNATFSASIGDGSRVNMLPNGSFSAVAPPPSLGPGWTIGSGVAAHSGAVGNMSWGTAYVTIVAGKTYRVHWVASNVSGAGCRSQLSGGTSVVNGYKTTDGVFMEKLTAISGNTTFSLSAETGFTGSVDDVVMYEQTATCIGQNLWDIHVFPENAQNQPGLASPVIRNIRVI